MFGIFEKKSVPISDKDVIKLMPADKAHFADLICEGDIPRDLYQVTGIEVTIRRQSVERKLVRCRDKVTTIISRLKKRQAVVYYVAPTWFELTVTDGDGSRVRCDARFNITPETSAGMVDWLERNINHPGDTLSIEKFSSLLSGKSKPEWLEVKNQELIAEPEAEAVPSEESEKSEVLTVDTIGEGSVVFNRYLIERELGKGGMGKVFLALDRKTPNKMRERVVLKVMHIETVYDPHALDQFVKEAETLSSLRNDRIAACYDCVMLGDTPILVMEYVEGESLDKVLMKHDSTLDEKTTKDLLLPIAQALDYAHLMKIYHLDVKPQNIMVRNKPKAGLKTCLLDFGIAKKAHADGSLTFTMSVAGTRPYMSQEQRNGEAATAAMDVFALAVTAYECLSGEMPYPHGQTRSHSVRPLPSDSPFARAIMRGLDIDPSKRPRTCEELINPSVDHVDPNQQKGRDPMKPPVEQPVSRPKVAESLSVLEKTFVNYRLMLSQSAARVAKVDADQAEWMRGRQAALRDLTKDMASVNPRDLVSFFSEVKAKLAELKTTPEDFFVAADRLMELRCGLPKQGGSVWQAIYESVN